jgi:hypothetical protein
VVEENARRGRWICPAGLSLRLRRVHDRARHRRYTAGFMASSGADQRIAQDRIAAPEGPVVLVQGIG